MTNETCGRLTNWWEAYQLAIYKRGRGFEQETTVKQIQEVRAGLEPGTSGLQVQRSNHSAKLQAGQKGDGQLN